jgi:hypothetical protein
LFFALSFTNFLFSTDKLRNFAMGGLFKPSIPKPSKTPVVGDDPEEKSVDDVARRRRGRSQTISSSPKGFLVEVEGAVRRKSLLGE